MAVNTGTNWNAYDAATMTAREIYGRTLTELGKNDDRIVGVTADLANTTAIVHFANAFPERFFNVGIAEQNMFGVAAGLAKAGLIPFASTMAIFACLRAGEQVRTDIAYQSLPVKIIATHAGISFGHAGTTHHCTEDFAVMRSIANMTVICPADGIETSMAVQACAKTPGPVYIRIGRGFEPPCYENANYDFEIGKAITMRDGTDITVICCGIAVLQTLQAAKTLAEQDGISVRVINMHTIKPIDREAILKAVVDTRRILTIEEHNVIGGLGDAVGSVIAESGKGCVFKKHGIYDEFATIGYAEDLYSYYGLDANGIVDQVRAIMGKEFEADESWDDE
ncbi:MAG: transketolase C-terminal domain-containing protein [Christensenella sp.]|nr:transketolase C-terminal domain-containing protein [Christensenella sp.]